jgi:tetratricopeptide (TPR) repeat protein
MSVNPKSGRLLCLVRNPPRDLTVEPTVIHEPAAITGKSHDIEPSAPAPANGQLVAGHIPAQRSGFQPRPALLAQLDRAGREAPVLVLTGIPGVGKTQLAAAYARARLAGGWRLVAWVSAQDHESLQAGLASVADAIRRPDLGRGAADPGQVVRHWLEADGDRCLLVFDDADDPAVLRPFLPAGGAARVLITAAREPVAELGVAIPVDVFSPEEALALLNGRTGLDDEAGAAAVAAKLGHLPFGLDQAAAAITGQDLGYTAYLAQLRVLPVEKYQACAAEQPYRQGAAEAVLLSLVAAGAADRSGVCSGVLEIMAVLSPAVVRRDLLRAAGPMGLLASGGHRVAAPLVDQALAQLEERSLLGSSLDGQTASIHRLVAGVVREGLAHRERLVVACRAAASTLEASAEALGKPPARTAVRELQGQVTALLDNARDAGDGDLARMLLRLRFLVLSHLIELGDSMPQAIATGEPLAAELERLLGPEHPDTLNAWHALAAAYQAAGRAADAVRLFEQTLAGRERLLGPDHPDTMTAQNDLAAAYQDTGRSAEAIVLYRMTLAGREWLLGPDHPDTVRSRNNLAATYREVGRVADAVPLIEQVLAVRERVSGAEDPGTLASRNNLAAAYREVGRAAEAVPLFEQNLAACERLLGPDHPRTQATRHHLTLARQEADGDAVGEGDADGLGEADLDGLGDREGLGDRDRDGDRDGFGDGDGRSDGDSTGGKTTA